MGDGVCNTSPCRWCVGAFQGKGVIRWALQQHIHPFPRAHKQFHHGIVTEARHLLPIHAHEHVAPVHARRGRRAARDDVAHPARLPDLQPPALTLAAIEAHHTLRGDGDGDRGRR